MKIQHLGVALLALTASACHGLQATPTSLAPSPVPSRLTVTVSPAAVLRSGSNATISASLLDTNGALVRGEILRFATSSGTLSAAQGATNANGGVAVTLTADVPATVTVSGPGVAPVSTSIEAIAPFALDLVAPGQTYVDDTPIDVIITKTTALAGPSPASVSVRCGASAAPTTPFGTVGTLSTRCSFPSVGPQIVTATATVNNFTTTGTLRVTANARPDLTPQVNPLVLTYRRSQITRTSVTVQFNVTNPGPEHLNLTYQWDFGDGTMETSDSGQIDHTYTTPGFKDVVVTARERDGRTFQARTRVVVEFPSN